jgi:hypothetical protein
VSSEITAAGQDTSGISSLGRLGRGPINTTLEDSYVSAEVALHDSHYLRLVDSRISGAVSFGGDGSRLEIVRSSVIGRNSDAGDLRLGGHGASVVVTDSSIEGDMRLTNLPNNAYGEFRFTSTHVKGGAGAGVATAKVFDGVTVHGRLSFPGGEQDAQVLRSYIINTEEPGPALSIGLSNGKVVQTFVQGALVAGSGPAGTGHPGHIEVSSSVLAGPVSAFDGASFSCTETYGADYELLSASCQPQEP